MVLRAALKPSEVLIGYMREVSRTMEMRAKGRSARARIPIKPEGVPHVLTPPKRRTWAEKV